MKRIKAKEYTGTIKIGNFELYTYKDKPLSVFIVRGAKASEYSVGELERRIEALFEEEF